MNEQQNKEATENEMSVAWLVSILAIEHPKFLVGRHWWLLKSLSVNEDGDLDQVEGQWSPGHHLCKTFKTADVRDASEIACVIRLFERLRDPNRDDESANSYENLYVQSVSAGHARGCPLSIPEFRTPEYKGATCLCAKLAAGGQQ